MPIGSEKYVTSEIKDIAVGIANDAMKTAEVLSSNKQALWAALKLSVSQRFQYICQHVQPSLCEPVAEWLDQQLWHTLEQTVGFQIPGGEIEGSLKIDIPVDGLNGRTFQQ